MAQEVLVLKLKLDASSTIKTQDDLIKRNKELAKLIKQAPLEGQEGFEELSESIKKAQKEYATNRQEILKFNAALKDTDEAADSMKGLSKTLKVLETEYKSLSKEQRDAFGEDLKKDITATRKALGDLEADLGDYRRNVGNYPDITKANFFGLGSVVKELGVAAAAAFTFDSAKAAAAKIAEVTEQFKVLRGEVQNLTGATGSALDGFTTDISAISSTFGEDTDQILAAANSLTKNLTGDFSESLRLIEEGFLSGANANGELLDSLTEYPALIAETGASADQFLAIISQSAKGGIFSDKGVDAIKEAGLKLREQTTATQDAIIGLFGESEGKSLLGDLETGEVTTIEAIQKVSEKLGELPPQSKLVGTAIADIFGGAGEDAGLEFLKSLKDIDGGAGALIDTTNELTRSHIAQLSVEKRLAVAQNETSKRFATLVDGVSNLSKFIQALLFTALNSIVDALAPIFTAFSSLGAKLVELGTRFGIISDEGGIFSLALTAINSALTLFGSAVGLVIDFVGFLVDSVIYAYDNFEIFRTIVDRVVSTFSFLRDVIGAIPAVFNGVVAATKQLGSNLLDTFSAILLTGQIFAKELEGVFTFDSSASDQINREIQDLVAQRDEIAAAGRTVGEAFREGFEQTIAEIAATPEAEEAPAEAAGEEAGKAFNKGFNKELEAQAGSTEALQAKVTKLQGLLNKLVPGSENFLEVVEKTKKAIAELSAAEEIKEALLSTEEIIALQEGALVTLRKSVSDLNEQLQTLTPGSEVFLEVADKVKQATAALAEAEKIREEALLTDDELAAKKKESAEKLATELAAIEAKALDARRAELDLELAQIKANSTKIRDEKLAATELTAEQREAIIAETEEAITQLELDSQKQRLSLLAEGSIEKLNLEAKIAQSELAIRQKLYDEDVASSLAAEEKKQAARKRFKDIALEVASTVADAAFAIAKNDLDRQVAAQLEALDKETEAKLVSAQGSEEEQIRIKESAETKKQAIEKAAAKKRKEQAIIQALINGALAAISTLANTTVPYPAAFALLIPTAIAVAAQIAVISSQQFKKGKAPKRASRGLLPRGNTHPQGGIPAVIGGQELVEIEDHEAILTAAASRKHLQLASDMNQEGGGIQYPGTRRLTPARRKRLNLFSAATSGDVVLAKRGLAPRIPSLIVKKRKFQDGNIATVGNVQIPTSGLTDEDVALIAKAAAAGTRAGIEAANLFENFKKQNEREAELDDRGKV